jgi:menaquinone-dependent protoporphyrinogen oxidase
MGTVLVVYGTKSGCTAEIAQRIGQALTAAGAKVDVVSVKDRPDPARYDAVVVGSGARAGRWHGAVSKWVGQHAQALGARPTAFFTACLTLASSPEKTAEVKAYTDPLLAQTKIAPVDHGLFAGWNVPGSFGLLERLVLKVIKAPRGDFRDMAAVEAWARALAPKLGVG